MLCFRVGAEEGSGTDGSRGRRGCEGGGGGGGQSGLYVPNER